MFSKCHLHLDRDFLIFRRPRAKMPFYLDANGGCGGRLCWGFFGEDHHTAIAATKEARFLAVR
jgi:hypothetical protein